MDFDNFAYVMEEVLFNCGFEACRRWHKVLPKANSVSRLAAGFNSSKSASKRDVRGGASALDA